MADKRTPKTTTDTPCSPSNNEHDMSHQHGQEVSPSGSLEGEHQQVKHHRHEIIRLIKLGDYEKALKRKAEHLLTIVKVRDGVFTFPFIRNYNKDKNPYIVESDDNGGYRHRSGTKPCPGFITRGYCVHTTLAAKIDESMDIATHKKKMIEHGVMGRDLDDYR